MKEWQKNMVVAIAMTETGKDYSDNPLEVAELLVNANENEKVRTALDKVLYKWENEEREEIAIDKILRDYIANPRKAKSGKIKKTSEVLKFSNAIATPAGEATFSNMYKVARVMKSEGIVK